MISREEVFKDKIITIGDRKFLVKYSDDIKVHGDNVYKHQRDYYEENIKALISGTYFEGLLLDHILWMLADPLLKFKDARLLDSHAIQIETTAGKIILVYSYGTKTNYIAYVQTIYYPLGLSFDSFEELENVLEDMY